MDEMLESLVSKLMDLKYESRGYSGGTYQLNVVGEKIEILLRLLSLNGMISILV